MKVKLRTTMAGPDGTANPGDIVDLPNWQELIDGGFAESIEVETAKAAKDAKAKSDSDPSSSGEKEEVPDTETAKAAKDAKAKK